MSQATDHASPTTGSEGGRDPVKRLFDVEARRWDDLYEGHAPQDSAIQHRLAITLNWVDRLGLNPGSPVLEVGCGAGRLAAALGHRGLSVCAVDLSPKMIEQTSERIKKEGLTRLVTARLGDVNSLNAERESFDLVVALGVIDWLQSPLRALQEMARVLRPGGSLIFSCGHPGALVYFIEPLTNPLLASTVGAAKHILETLRVREVKARQNMYTVRSLNRLVSISGLTRVDSRTVGFGPITILRWSLLPNTLGARFNRWLQERADRGVQVVRSLGMAYMVLARKPSSHPSRIRVPM